MPKRERVQTQKSNASLEANLDTALSGSPKPLSAETRALMEPKFGHSFANVQVFDNAPDTLNARAFAFEDNLAFSAGQYAPGTPAGDHLIAHELAHVVQSRDATGNATRVSEPFEALETEASRAADAVTGGSSAPSLTRSSAGVVSRSVWDWLPGGNPMNPTPFQQLPDAPGEGAQAGPYFYGNQKNAGEYSGYNFGAGRGHAQTSTRGQNILLDGDEGSAGASYDAEKYEGHAGAWSSQRPDGTSETNYGINLNAKTFSGQGNATWGMQGGPGAYVHGDVAGPSADLSAYAGDGGFALGAQASVAGFNVGAGSRGTEQDEYGKFGLSEGVGAAGRGYWGDTDGDGFREYGFGVDAGPVSVDLRTEDPLRTGVRMLGNTIPGGGLIAEQFIDPGNFTERTANRVGLTTRNANLSTTWDVISGAGESVADGAMSAGRGLWNAAGNAYDYAADTAMSAEQGLERAAQRGVNRVANAGRAVGAMAGSAYDSASNAANSAYDYVAENAGAAVNTASNAGTAAYNYAAENLGAAASTVSDMGTAAYDYAAGGVSSAASSVSNAASSAWNALPDWDW
jgi:hypothetical protein